MQSFFSRSRGLKLAAGASAATLVHEGAPGRTRSLPNRPQAGAVSHRGVNDSKGGTQGTTQGRRSKQFNLRRNGNGVVVLSPQGKGRSGQAPSLKGRERQ